ncbi:MAG: DMP19 family protein [Clostridiales bacterium]|nr:DMP19 family protein [Clostridiales bacterium]
MLILTGFFRSGEPGYYLLLLFVAALLAAAWLWGRRRSRRTPADEWMKRYALLDRALLDATPDEELVNAVAGNLLARLDSRHPDPYREIPLLSPGRCAVYSIWLICHELEEGGFEGLYAQGSGGFVELAADGLDQIGAPDCALAVRRVCETQEGDRDAALPALTAAFQEAVEREQPLTLCIAYIRDNPLEFVDGGPLSANANSAAE